eukprot:349902-Chlamydomonas_euryale.AAC.2
MSPAARSADRRSLSCGSSSLDDLGVGRGVGCEVCWLYHTCGRDVASVTRGREQGTAAQRLSSCPWQPRTATSGAYGHVQRVAADEDMGMHVGKHDKGTPRDAEMMS